MLTGYPCFILEKDQPTLLTVALTPPETCDDPCPFVSATSALVLAWACESLVGKWRFQAVGRFVWQCQQLISSVNVTKYTSRQKVIPIAARCLEYIAAR